MEKNRFYNTGILRPHLNQLRKKSSQLLRPPVANTQTQHAGRMSRRRKTDERVAICVDLKSEPQYKRHSTFR